ncbi:MAG TPA: cyclic nucleotide-binding domain-containing protein, partial [Actinomycetota bacterium]|nr:cyclic nucleotide-binding domain-containing protein [Actinomycetota bacterium]
YFVESGRLSVHVGGGGADMRIRSFGPGSVIGEVSLYLRTPRTATVVADSDAVLYHLPADAVDRMEQQDPGTAAALHRALGRMMATRLVDTTATAAALQD